jgi:hypothetical protein
MAFAFDDELALIDDGSAGLRAAVVAADQLTAAVPGCPDWTLRDLVIHVGQVQSYWAAVVRAGDTEVEWREGVLARATTSELLDWSAKTTGQ